MRQEQVKKTSISINVVRRLPRYLRELDALIAEGVRHASSYELSKQMGFSASQIRQDLSNYGGFGQQGYGYDVQLLRNEIADILGMKQNYSVALIGMGKLGRVILENFPRVAKGYRLVAVFEKNEGEIGKTINGYPVLDEKELMRFSRDNPIDIAILAVPQEEAQHMAEILVKSNVRGIWNFTDTELCIDGDTLVENINFSDSFLVLSYFLAMEDKKLYLNLGGKRNKPSVISKMQNSLP